MSRSCEFPPTHPLSARSNPDICYFRVPSEVFLLSAANQMRLHTVFSTVFGVRAFLNFSPSVQIIFDVSNSGSLLEKCRRISSGLKGSC